MALLVRLFSVEEIEEWHRTGIPIRCLDGPLVRHEVILMEQLSALSGLRYDTLRFTDVTHDDIAHIGVKLLSG